MNYALTLSYDARGMAEICFTNFTALSFMPQPAVASTTQQYRQRIVTMALNLTKDTHMSAGKYERTLLDQFAQGTLKIDQVVALLERQEQE